EAEAEAKKLIGSIEITEKELVTVLFIETRLGRELLVSDLLSKTDEYFLALKGVGQGKLHHISALRERVSKYINLIEEMPFKDTEEPKPSDALIISELALPHEYKVVCSLLCKHLGDQVTLGDIRRLEHKELKAIPSMGEKKISRVKDIIQYIDNRDLSSFDREVEEHRVQLYSGREEFDLSELEKTLLEDLESFFATLNERDEYIISQRLGYGTERVTLQEIGDSLPSGRVTRERVRQLQQRIEINWRAHMRIAPVTLRVNVKSNLSVLRGTLFPQLQALFSSVKGFYEFLEMSSELPGGGLTKIVYPDISPSVLDDYWVEHPSPSDLDSITSYLQDRLGLGKAVSENAISNLSGQKVELLGELILPLNLSKPLAIANTLLDYPAGLTWKNLHKKANEKGISRASLPEDRVDGAIGTAVDQGWVYQYDRGSYKHLTYLDLSVACIESTLNSVHKVLVNASNEGRDALNLSIDYYRDSDNKELDYFTVRHIVRAHGERLGIFFSGKSGADTISLEKDFSLANQQVVLEQLFASSEKPLDKAYVASKIRSQSVGHASFYLDQLLTKGIIVRVDESSYQLTEKAFSSLNIKSIILAAADIIEKEDRVIELGVIQKLLNQRLDQDINKYLYLSLLKTYNKEYGFNWHFAYNLVSKKETRFESLIDLCRTLLSEVDSFDNAKSVVEQYCLIDESRLRVVFGQYRNQVDRT
ncbi:hypothetical protein AB4304_00970, partial [Vibrio breoganii]